MISTKGMSSVRRCHCLVIRGRNPRGSSVKALDLEDIREFLKRKEEKGLGTLVAHAPYTLNACSKIWQDWSIRQVTFTISIREAM